MSAVLKPAYERKELLIGCGGRRVKDITWDHSNELRSIDPRWGNLVTLDIEPRHKPDVVHDLDVLPYPFPDNEFDEIHAYEVLEHCGTQGDWKFFFAQFTEFHRILAPDGYFVASVPSWDSVWAWSDPGHRRIISQGSISFLRQAHYAEQVGKTSSTDYRDVYKADFEILDTGERQGQFFFALRAVK